MTPPAAGPRPKRRARLVVRAARDLFIAQGYGHTTVADIGRAAGVSVETIYAAFGSKAALLHRAWDITVGGDDQDIVFHERPEVIAIRREPDLVKRLMLHAAFSTRTAQRIAPFQLMVQSAAGADQAAAAMLEEMGRQRLAGMSVMAAEVAKTGQLAVSEDECRDVMWSMTDGVLAQAGDRARLDQRAIRRVARTDLGAPPGEVLRASSGPQLARRPSWGRAWRSWSWWRAPCCAASGSTGAGGRVGVIVWSQC